MTNLDTYSLDEAVDYMKCPLYWAIKSNDKVGSVAKKAGSLYATLLRRSVVDSIARDKGFGMSPNSKRVIDGFAKDWETHIGKKDNLTLYSDGSPVKPLTHAKYVTKAKRFIRYISNKFFNKDVHLVGTNFPWKVDCNGICVWGVYDILIFDSSSGILSAICMETEDEPYSNKSFWINTLRSVSIRSSSRELRVKPKRIELCIIHPTHEIERRFGNRADLYKTCFSMLFSVAKSMQENNVWANNTKQNCNSCSYNRVCDWSEYESKRGKSFFKIPSKYPGFLYNKECPI